MTTQSPSHTESRPVTSSSLQSTLLRLCLICASSQSALREEIPLQILSYNEPIPSVLPGDELLSQIRNDILSLLSLIQKHSTALTLALKPSKTTKASSTSLTSISDSVSPTTGLDEPSLKAAQSQLQSLLSDITPKLAFLVLTALKSRAIYQRSPPSKQELDKMSKEDKEREELRVEVEKMGGKLMSGEQLGIKDSASSASRGRIPTPGEAIRLGGIGIAWSNQLRIIVEEVLEKLAFLAESFMDQKTLNAVELAEKSRQKKASSSSNSGANASANVDSNAIPSSIKSSPSSTQFNKKAPTSIKEARQSALEKTKALDNLCESIKEQGRIPFSNEAMCRELWKRNEEIMEDGEKELREAIKNSKGSQEQELTLSLDFLDIDGLQDENDEQQSQDGNRSVRQKADVPETETDRALADASKALDSLGLDAEVEDQDGFGMEELSQIQRERALGLSPLIRIGKLMHRRVGTLCLTSASASTCASTSTSDSTTTSLAASSATTTQPTSTSFSSPATLPNISTSKPTPQVDQDLLSELSTSLLDAQDDLICAALYGSNGYGDLLGSLEERSQDNDDDDDEGPDLDEVDDDEENDLECIREACRNYVDISRRLSEAASIGIGQRDARGESQDKDTREYFKLCSQEIEKLARIRGYLD